MTYYKVVQKYNGTLYSAIATNHEVVLEYIPMEWRVPEIPRSKLFVFADEEKAKSFALKTRDIYIISTEVWACEVKNPESIPVALSGYDLNILSNQQEFWGGGWRYQTLIQTPDGTFGADAIMLTYKIWESDTEHDMQSL